MYRTVSWSYLFVISCTGVAAAKEARKRGSSEATSECVATISREFRLKRLMFKACGENRDNVKSFSRPKENLPKYAYQKTVFVSIGYQDHSRETTCVRNRGIAAPKDDARRSSRIIRLPKELAEAINLKGRMPVRYRRDVP